MISAILFGRNDDHGGHLRARSALSINMLAEQLGNTDEIIFVDWASPPGHPSLPEAISGALTRKARALLRVLLVDTATHDQWVKRGATLPVVPVVAYNAAIRRSDPANRWTLITTTDTLLMSRVPGRSLSDIAAALERGVYGLPRFELPVWIWQGFEPTRPDGAALGLANWGRRLHLEEAVRLPQPELFDSPGDFQLVWREDLFAIDGLDEGLALGSTGPDSNLLARLRLKGHTTRSLERQLAIYHCDHTALRALPHDENRVQNDMTLFFEEVARAECPYQRSTWGLAGRELRSAAIAEQVASASTGPADPLAAAALPDRLACVADALAPAQNAAYDTRPQFNRASYPTKHVLPHLLNHLYESQGPIAYVGANGGLLSLASSIVQRSDPGRTFAGLAPDDWLAIEAFCASGAGSVIIFDLGTDADEHPDNPAIEDCGESVRASLVAIRQAFEHCIGLLRANPPTHPPRIAVINAINTEFEALVLASLECDLSPFTTRIRSGFVSATSPAIPTMNHPAAAGMAVRLGRRSGVHVREFARSWAIAERLSKMTPADPIPPNWRTRSVAALLQWPELGKAFEAADDRIADIRLQIVAPPHRLDAGVAAKPNDPVALSKVASVQDWESDEWYEFARWYVGDHSTYNIYQRHRRDWERIHIAYALARLGCLDSGAEVAFLATDPDVLPLRLANRLRKVHLINVGKRKAQTLLRAPALCPLAAVTVHQGLSDPALADLRFDAVIALRQKAMPPRTIDLARVQRLLKDRGRFALSFDVATDAATGLDWLRRWRRSVPRVQELAAGETFFWPVLPDRLTTVASEDWSVDAETLSLVAPPANWRWRHMTADRHGLRRTSAVRWFAKP